jgi:hypothetical protein
MQIYQYVRQDQSAHQDYLDALMEATQSFSFICVKRTEHSMPLHSLAALGGSPKPGHVRSAH